MWFLSDKLSHALGYPRSEALKEVSRLSVVGLAMFLPSNTSTFSLNSSVF